MDCNLSVISVTDSEEGVIPEWSVNPTSYMNFKSSTKKQKREVTLTINSKNESLIITQKVKIKKVKHNLKVGITTNRNEIARECSKNQDKTKVVTDRIVPDCYRLKCGRRVQKSRRECPNRSRFNKSNNRIRDKKRHSNKHKRNLCKDGRNKEKLKNNLNRSLSPISLTSLDDKEDGPLQISYENVSSDSFTSESDSELDTLIKRTKAREKHMILSSNFLCKPCTSSPHSIVNISSGDTISDNSTSPSIHSQATVVLDRQLLNIDYSPIINHGCEAGSLQPFDGNREEHHLGEQKTNVNTKFVDPNTKSFMYYHNMSNNSDFENNNNIIYCEQNIKLKKSPN